MYSGTFEDVSPKKKIDRHPGSLVIGLFALLEYSSVLWQSGK